MTVAARRAHFKYAVVQRQQGNIKRSAAEIENQHIPLTNRLLIEAIGNRGRCRLVDNSENIQAGNNTRILRRLALRIVEIRGHRHHCILYCITEVRLRDRLHLLKDHR